MLGARGSHVAISNTGVCPVRKNRIRVKVLGQRRHSSRTLHSPRMLLCRLSAHTRVSGSVASRSLRTASPVGHSRLPSFTSNNSVAFDGITFPARLSRYARRGGINSVRVQR
jgi:hypothetical protein